MTVITLNIPESIKQKIGIGDEVSYENLIIKTIGGEYISPDLNFINYDKMSKNHKEEYNKLDNIDKNKLLNI